MLKHNTNEQYEPSLVDPLISALILLVAQRQILTDDTKPLELTHNLLEIDLSSRICGDQYIDIPTSRRAPPIPCSNQACCNRAS